MNANVFFLILRARRRIVLTAFLVTVLATALVSFVLPKTYTATSSVVLNFKGVDPLTGMTMPGQLLPGYMATQVDIISSRNVALRVVDALKLAQSPAVLAEFSSTTGGRGDVRDWLAELLLKKLDVAPSRESSVIDITFKGSDPQFVAAVANAFADEYQRVAIQLKVDPLKRASAYFNEQIKTLRDNVEAAQSRLSKFQQEHGIVSVDNRLDVETNRLNDLSAQLVGAQGQRMEASSRQSMALGNSGTESPDVVTNPLIQNLKASLAQSEAKLAEMGQRLSPNHPQYQSAVAETEKLRNELKAQLRLVANSVGNNATVMSQREASIRAALEAQKAKVLELNRTRDELSVLARDVDNAQRAFDTTSQRFAQTRVEGQAEQSDIAVLNPAKPPIEPSNPKIVLNIALSVVLGAMLGVGFAVLAEVFDRRVRGEVDLVDALDIPVFGAIDWKDTPTRSVNGIQAILRPRLT